MVGVAPDILRSMIDKAKEQESDLVAVLYSVNDDKKASVAVGVSQEAIKKGLHAGKLVKEITSLVGGSGGGRPDCAMGGATKIFEIDEAVAKIPDMIRGMMKK